MFTAVLAIIGTTSLAWVMTQRGHAMQVESPPNWPISFSIPEGFIQIDNPYEDKDDEFVDGYSAQATYVLETARGVEAVVVVSYEVPDDDDLTLEELLVARGADRRDEIEDALLGTLKARRFRLMDQRGRAVTQIAVGQTRDGLIIDVRYRGAAHDPRGPVRFERICESIQFRKWSMPRPAAETSRRPRR